MMSPIDCDPQDFFGTDEPRLEDYEKQKRFWKGGLFISHSGLDTAQIRTYLIQPVIYDRFPADGFFLHSSRSGGASAYKALVTAALHFCDKALVVVTFNSVTNPWVKAEVTWLLGKGRPIIRTLRQRK